MMDKNSKLLRISTMLAIFGLFFSIGSGKIGNVLGDLWLKNMGGVADTVQYEFIKNTYYTSFLVIGSILFGISLLAMLFSWYKMQE